MYYETVAGGQGGRPGRPGMSGVQTGMTNTVKSDPPLPGMSGVQTGMTNTVNSDPHLPLLMGSHPLGARTPPDAHGRRGRCLVGD